MNLASRDRARVLLLTLGAPLVAVALFLWIWSFSAARVQTSLGTVPGPAQVVAQGKALLEDHFAERAKAAEFYQKQDERNQQRTKEEADYKPTAHRWTGKPTFIEDRKSVV